MTTWSKNELAKIAKADDLHIAPFREDGKTYGTPTWIWSVVVDDALYVRAYNGRSSRWYQAAIRQKAGRIIVAGMTKEVTFEPVEGAINDRIDDAYRAKYAHSPYLTPMIAARARRNDQVHALLATQRERCGNDMSRFTSIQQRNTNWAIKVKALNQALKLMTARRFARNASKVHQENNNEE